MFILVNELFLRVATDIPLFGSSTKHVFVCALFYLSYSLSCLGRYIWHMKEVLIFGIVDLAILNRPDLPCLGRSHLSWLTPSELVLRLKVAIIFLLISEKFKLHQSTWVFAAECSEETCLLIINEISIICLLRCWLSLWYNRTRSIYRTKRPRHRQWSHVVDPRSQ